MSSNPVLCISRPPRLHEARFCRPFKAELSLRLRYSLLYSELRLVCLAEQGSLKEDLPVYSARKVPGVRAAIPFNDMEVSVAAGVDVRPCHTSLWCGLG